MSGALLKQKGNNMPSTSVAAAQNSWKRQAHKYKKKDASKSAARERQKIERERAMAQRKGAKK